MKERIIEMLGNGVSATAVAAALGVTDGYVSQVLNEEGVTEKVQELRAAKYAAFAQEDDDLNKAEAAALRRVNQLLPLMTKPTDAARVFSILNAAKRKVGSVESAAPVGATIIQIALPEAAKVSFTLSSDRQVVEVEDRSLITMPAKNLAARLEQRNASRLLSVSIPSSTLLSKL